MDFIALDQSPKATGLALFINNEVSMTLYHGRQKDMLAWIAGMIHGTELVVLEAVGHYRNQQTGLRLAEFKGEIKGFMEGLYRRYPDQNRKPPRWVEVHPRTVDKHVRLWLMDYITGMAQRFRAIHRPTGSNARQRISSLPHFVMDWI
jgi:hypothetical protein